MPRTTQLKRSSKRFETWDDEKGKKPERFLEVPLERLVEHVGVSMVFEQCVFFTFFSSDGEIGLL